MLSPQNRTSLNSIQNAESIPRYSGQMEDDLRIVARNGAAEEITGGLSWPSKLPCPAWGIPAFRCKLGSILQRENNTVCSQCYALKGRYRFDRVQQKLEQRYRGLFDPLWTPAMVFLIGWHADRYFRFFDSGDLQDVNHLHNICVIARSIPDVRMWLPTRERGIVASYAGDIPENLVVRLSAQQIDGGPPASWHNTSTVHSLQAADGSHICPARQQGNHCRRCRACWDAEVKNVSYPLH